MEQKCQTVDVGSLSVKCGEMVGISKFCKFPSRFISQVQDSWERIVLIKNGEPIAAVVSLSRLAALESVNSTKNR
jgi:hypothetical protein